MKIPNDYHSALKEEISTNKELFFFKKGETLIFYHNIEEGIHPLFYGAKSIYSEISWRSGYKTFLERAGQNGDYKNYLININKIIKELKIPTFLIYGKEIRQYFNPDREVNIKLHNYPSILGIWNAKVDIGFKDNLEVLEFISQRYEKTLDFSCGYGNILKYKKDVILSDINKKALYFLSNKFFNNDKILDITFREAITYRHTFPHEYILEKEYPLFFKYMRELINKKGYTKNFFSKTYKYLDIGNYKYWIVDCVLNRAEKNENRINQYR